MAPRVSVVVPTRGRPAAAARAVSAALAQGEPDLEVVVVDDGSEPPLVASGPLADPRVRLIRHDRALGVSRARNAGIEAAAGAWIAFLDDDDLWNPRKLERQLALAAAAATPPALVSTAYLLVSERGERLGAFAAPTGVTASRDLRRANVVGSPSSVLVSRAALERVGGFDPAFAVIADWELWLRLAEHGPLAAVDEPLTAIVVHPGSMQRVRVDEAEREVRRLDARLGGSILGRGPRHGVPRAQLWLAQMRYEAAPGPRAALRYGTEVLRAPDRRRRLRSGLRRHVAPLPAPAWTAAALDPDRS